MTTRSALLALLREAGVPYEETRSRVMMDITAASRESVDQFHDMALIYFVFKFGKPRGPDYYERPEVRDAIRYCPIEQRVNGVFKNPKAYTR